jgi:hypothetical protein
MILEKPVWVPDSDDRKWLPLETNRGFSLQYYRYGGLGKGVQTTYRLLAIAKIVHETPTSSLALGLHGNYRIVTAFPVYCKHFKRKKTDKEELLSSEPVVQNDGSEAAHRDSGDEDVNEVSGRKRRWQLAESNNLAAARHDLLMLCHKLNSLLTSVELRVSCLGVVEGKAAGAMSEEAMRVLKSVAKWVSKLAILDSFFLLLCIFAALYFVHAQTYTRIYTPAI